MTVRYLGLSKEQGPSAGALQTGGSVFFRKGDDPLGGPQVVQHPVGKQMPDQAMAVGADGFSLAQTPLRILHLVGDGLRGQMLIHGGAGAGFAQTGMDGHQFQVAKDLDGVVGGP